jgi:hypothetical protein
MVLEAISPNMFSGFEIKNFDDSNLFRPILLNQAIFKFRFFIVNFVLYCYFLNKNICNIV